MILVILLLLMMIARIGAEVVCYHCYGNSTDQGQLCSIDKLCLGQSCYFKVLESGEWSSGCSDMVAPPDLICMENATGTSTTCHCTADLCNQFKSVNETLLKFWGKKSATNVTLFLPQLSVNCIECGNITIAGRNLTIPCVRERVCRGDYCVLKRGLTPHSYCGSAWEGAGEDRCFKRPGEEEQCVCVNNMCNVMLSPETLESMLRPSTTTITTPMASTMIIRTLSPSQEASSSAAATGLGSTATNTSGSSHSTSQNPSTITVTSNLTVATNATTGVTKPAQLPSLATTTTKQPAEGTVPTEAQIPPTTPPKTKKCKNGMKFSPNAQAVLMGQKLGQLINGGFGSGSNDVKEFQQGIDTHNCNYSE